MKLASTLLFLFLSESALAKDIPLQGRLFGGSVAIDPKDVNEEMEAQSLKKFNLLLQYGFEVSYPLVRFFNIGLRLTKRNISRDENPAVEATDYRAEIHQESLQLIGRIPFLNTTFLRMDAFAGFGGTNTIMKIRTASQYGEISRKNGSNGFASTMSSFGGSVAVGYKQVYFLVEGGVETNSASKLKRTGTVNNNIEAIDLSGSFFTIGVLFDGIKPKK